jgi:hypothetical protein
MDTHEQLMILFRQYFKENQDWESKRTHVAGIRCRNILAEIRILARKRRAEILELRKQKPSQSSPAYFESNRRKAEAKKAKQVDVVVPPESTDNRTS